MKILLTDIKPILDFEKHVKHLRFESDPDFSYHHEEVKKRFYEVLSILGEPVDDDLVAFVTLRLKKRSEWVDANNAANALEWKLSRLFWGRKSKYKKLPFVASIEHSHKLIRDHLHVMVRLTSLREEYSVSLLNEKIDEVCRNLKEVNEKNSESVDISIFPYTFNSYELGNKVEYICKTSSKMYNPIQRLLPHQFNIHTKKK
jgi:hypothetical protein